MAKKRFEKHDDRRVAGEPGYRAPRVAGELARRSTASKRAKQSQAPDDGDDIVVATRSYEAWLRHRTHLVKRDLQTKHRQMAKRQPFRFLRATFYRWTKRFPAVCPDLAAAPRVLAVGDLHVENFGTWRDAEGRLVWGVNDFDEAHPLPYTNDLVRLATSIFLAVRPGKLQTPPARICELLLAGYRKSLRARGRPFVLAEDHPTLRAIALEKLGDPCAFWEKRAAETKRVATMPPDAERLVRQTLDNPRLPLRASHRVAGLGSLGKRRYVAVGHWNGGQIAREAKALGRVGVHLGAGGTDGPTYLARLVDAAVRCRDPYLRVEEDWIVRRLSPDCSRIEIAELANARNETRLLKAMGWEIANVHLARPATAREILADLRRRPPGWLRAAADAMSDDTRADWRAWRKHQRRKSA